MAYLKQKKNLISINLVVNVAVIVAILANLALPSLVKAENSAFLANDSQKDVEISQDVDALDIKVTANGHLVNTLSHNKELPDKIVRAVITAYTSTPDQTDDTPDIAAWGDHVYDGMIAANWLPRGTKIKIPSLYGDKVFTVADRMNKRYGYGRLDIWLDSSKTDARKFGVKRLDVEIYYPESTDKELAKR